MSRNNELVKVIRNFYQKLRSCSPATLQEQRLWLLRTFLVNKRKPEWANAGFLLPTVAMVSLVVVLITIAILFRSFERSKNASNVRVNEATLNASKPAIDRAKAKITELFNDPELPRTTPTDKSLYVALTKDIGGGKTKLDKYTFGDEKQLLVQYDVNENKSIDDKADLEEKEVIKTAWKYPVDTNNDGKFDSYTLYGIFFRSPSRADATGKFDRTRNPLDARTPPMDDGALSDLCAAAKGTSASLIGESGWYKAGANIKKSFFVYTTTVPITEKQISEEGLSDQKFQPFKGSKGFSAIEYQQDQERIPLASYAVVYEDDLQISPGAGLKLNGAMLTNSNLIVGTEYNNVQFYQVSSPKSCFYNPQASKVLVGGNVGNGRLNVSATEKNVPFDLFNPGGIPKSDNVSKTNSSTSENAAKIAFNTQAFAKRINKLVEVQTSAAATTDPRIVQEIIQQRTTENTGLDPIEVRREELENWFKLRTMKVPFLKVPLGEETTDIGGSVTLQASGTDKLRGPDKWIQPLDGNTGLKLNTNKLQAVEPNRLKDFYKGAEQFLGDRILVGNNLPALWFDTDPKVNDFVGVRATQKVGTEWDDWKEKDFKDRTRSTRVRQLLSVSGATDRDGFFEAKAADIPKNQLDNVGGMRVVTGAGIYVDGAAADGASFPWDSATDLDKSTTGDQKGSFLKDARPSLDSNFVGVGDNQVKPDSLKFGTLNPIVVWSDAMPMTGGVGATSTKGDLLMRATAVYHYKKNTPVDKPETSVNESIAQTPIACVSSYYDPTNPITAQNNSNVSGSWKNPNADPATSLGQSNNGIVYPSYIGNREAAVSKYIAALERQARLVFPDGRFVNEPLRNAILQRKVGKALSMADNSAFDTAICAIEILKGATASANEVEHGMIYETSFLDAREIKSIQTKPNVADIPDTELPNFDRAIEERQPLEVRVTTLDVDRLRKTKIGGDDYLLPNSGIIYATREDALQDLSNSPKNKLADRKIVSPTDYKLDSTRRPNGIMLVNGEFLNREGKNDFKEAEKGLILATNVPAYIKGDFNLHAKGGDKTKAVEEFIDIKLRNDKGEIKWDDFYKREKLDPDFACRNKDPRLLGSCTTGDTWRPATVLADAVTVLSDNYRFGFRNEGDYDLRNNQGDIKSADYQKQGFFDNNYVTSSPWYRPSGGAIVDTKDFDTSSPKPGIPTAQGSSYVNNFVTPIQRRVRFGEYLMEICTKVPVTTCEAGDWSLDGVGTIKSDPNVVGQTYSIATYRAGTTVDLATPDLQRYARRVAFVRDSNRNLILDSTKQPVPLGIDSGKKIQAFPQNTVTGQSWTTGLLPEPKNNALWFRTIDGGKTNYGYGKPLFYWKPVTASKDNHPLLVPVLQVHVPSKDMTDPGADKLFKNISRGNGKDKEVDWLQTASPTTTNVIIVAGDTPSRAGTSTEYNGGLENFVRYLERWRIYGTNTELGHSISGSLIQYKRSAYATAPWETRQKDDTSIFGSDYKFNYPSDMNSGLTTFYTAPNRQWGFDVGLLSQKPDLFAQTFTNPPLVEPNEFFREVSRDDDWVKTLLCSRTTNGKNAVSEQERPKDFCIAKTGG
jgi:hypothetical protein